MESPGHNMARYLEGEQGIGSIQSWSARPISPELFSSTLVRAGRKLEVSGESALWSHSWAGSRFRSKPCVGALGKGEAQKTLNRTDPGGDLQHLSGM